ncbi:hypothetical protein L6R52_24595 [Myxococcota bacterium]|nr:hypothetical protein [Myxococcota bacterium]
MPDSRISVIPITPFIGVRISWLTFAMNCDLSRDASSASLRALVSSSSRTCSSSFCARSSSKARRAENSARAACLIRAHNVIEGACSITNSQRRSSIVVATIASGMPRTRGTVRNEPAVIRKNAGDGRNGGGTTVARRSRVGESTSNDVSMIEKSRRPAHRWPAR